MRRIKSVMSPFPYRLERSASQSEARTMMATHDVHHLPVYDGGDLIALLTHRELRVAERLVPDALVGDIAGPVPPVADLEASLDTVVGQLRDSGSDCALVTKESRLVGIFTVTDLARLMLGAGSPDLTA